MTILNWHMVNVQYLMIAITVSWPGRPSSATAGVIPFDLVRRSPVDYPTMTEEQPRFTDIGSGVTEAGIVDAGGFACPVGYYKVTEGIGISEQYTLFFMQRVTCIMCAACGCGAVMYDTHNAMTSCSSGDACPLSTSPCETVVNMTMGGCFSANGGGCLTRSPLPLISTTTSGMIWTLTTDVMTEGGISSVEVFGIIVGIVCIFILVLTAAIALGYRTGLSREMCIYSSCRQNGDTPSRTCMRGITSTIKDKTRLKPGFFKHRYDVIVQSLGREGETPSIPGGHHPLAMSVENIPLISTELPSAKDITVKTLTNDPYWLIMRGRFDSRGGVLHCAQSGVVLEVPSGAIPEDVASQEIVAKVALVTTRFDLKLRKDEVCLSPVVEFISPGLDKFDAKVTIKVPHRACLDPDWEFRVHFTQSHGVKEGGWQTVNMDGSSHGRDCNCVACLRSTSDEVTFDVNKTHFVIKTPHFSKYVCSGCGKKRYINLEAFLSAKYLNLADRQQVHLNCYVVDTIKDYSHRVLENEGQRPKSERHPIHLKSKDALEISLLTDNKYVGEDWMWKAETSGGALPTSQVIPLRSIIRCCSDAIPYFVTFSLRPKTIDKDDSPQTFEAFVAFRQKGSTIDLTIPIVFDLRRNQSPSLSLCSTPSTPRPVAERALERTARDLPMDKWRPLCRRLLSDEPRVETVIEQLQHTYGDNAGELKYQMLVGWKQRSGRRATVQRLGKVLKECGLVCLAESLEEEVTVFGDAEWASNISSSD